MLEWRIRRGDTVLGTLEGWRGDPCDNTVVCAQWENCSVNGQLPVVKLIYHSVIYYFTYLTRELKGECIALSLLNK